MMRHLAPLAVLGLLWGSACHSTPISSYPAATAPLTGSELLLGDQGGVTKKFTAAQL